MQRFNPLWLVIFLATFLTGCTRIVYVDSTAHDKVSTERTAEGAIAADLQRLVLEHQSGTVTVTGTDESPGWTWKLTCWGPDVATAEANAARCRIEATGDGTALRLKLVKDLDHAERVHLHSELVVRVPKTVAVEVQNTFGEVRVTGINASARISARNSRVILSGITGAVHAETSFSPLEAEEIGAAELANQNGAIRVRRVAGDLSAQTSFSELSAEMIHGKATLRNRNGAIQATTIGGDLDAETAFSPIRVRGVEGAAALRNQNGLVEAHEVTGPIDASTSFSPIELDSSSVAFSARNQNSAIRINARSPLVERIDASTSFSPLQLTLPSSTKPVIRAEATFGRIDSAFPVLVWSSVSDADFQAETGRPKITLRNQNASISIAKGAP